jgi:hypothetical protein
MVTLIASRVGMFAAFSYSYFLFRRYAFSFFKISKGKHGCRNGTSPRPLTVNESKWKQM